MAIIQDWDGEFLGEEIAILTFRDVSQALTAAVAAGSSRTVVRTDQLGRFLLTHVPSVLVCFGAARTHWALHHELEWQCDKVGLRALWRFSRRCRFNDVMLLDQRLRVVTKGVYPLPKKLHDFVAMYREDRPQASEINQRYCDRLHDGNRLSDEDEHLAVEVSAIILAAYHDLRGEADGIIRLKEIPTNTVARFGPLGLGVDVQGAIAVEGISQHGLSIDRKVLEELAQASEQTFREASSSLAHDRNASQCFEWEGSQVKKDENGYPEINKQRLRKWLMNLWFDLRDVNDVSFMPVRDDRGECSVVPEHWEPLVGCHRLLCAWRDLVSAAAVGRWLLSDHEGALRPRYAVIPHLDSLPPSIPAFRRLGALFRPRHGHSFLVGRIRDLELRCCATNCTLRRYYAGGSYIDQMFLNAATEEPPPLDGFDPVIHTAKRLHGLEGERREGPMDCDFVELAVTDPREYQHWLTLAALLLRAVPLGLDDAQVGELLAEELPEHDWRGARVQHFRRLLLKIHPDIGGLLEDNTFETVADWLGADHLDVAEACSLPETPGTMEAALRNALLGRTEWSSLWPRLRAITMRSPARELIADAQGSADKSILLTTFPVTLSGRVGLPTYLAQHRTAEYLDLADEVMKLVAYKVVAAGYQLVAVDGEEFILEVPTELAEQTADVKRLAEAAAGRLLDLLARGSCRCQARETW